MNKFKKVAVELDQPIFISGKNLSGKIRLRTNLLRNVQKVKLTLRGRASVSFICSNGLTVTKHRPLVNARIKTWTGEEIETELPFQFEIPADLPNSFVGSAGKVEYWLQVELKGFSLIPVGSNSIFRFPLVLSCPKCECFELQQYKKTKGFGAYQHCNAVLEWQLAKDRLAATLNVENNSKLTFYDIKMAVLKETVYIAHNFSYVSHHLR